MSSKFWLGDNVKCVDKVTPFKIGTVTNLEFVPNIEKFQYEITLPNGAKLFKYEEKLRRVVKP